MTDSRTLALHASESSARGWRITIRKTTAIACLAPALIVGKVHAQTLTLSTALPAGTYTLTPVTTTPPPPPAGTNWGYYNGNYTWWGDFSAPGGASGVLINYHDTTGAPLSGSADISVTANGNQWVIWTPVMSQSFSYPITGYTQLTISVKPTKANWSGQLYFMGVGDVPLGPNGTLCALTSTQFASYLVAGTGPSLAAGHWSTYTIPLSVLCVPAGGPVYKFALQDQTGDATNLWYVDNVGFAP